MAYSEFSLERAFRDLGYDLGGGDLFPGLSAAEPPGWLTGLLGLNTPLAFLNEKSRSESIIHPVLLAARKVSGDRLAVFSGQRLDADPARGLVGECDFILCLSPPYPPLRAPLVTIVEAQKADIELGLGQCVAEMAGARAFNTAAGAGHGPMFGCVTSGEGWQFLRLDAAAALMHVRRFYTQADLGLILGAFVAIADAATPAPAPE